MGDTLTWYEGFKLKSFTKRSLTKKIINTMARMNEDIRREYTEMYKNLFDAFGVGNYGWSQIHEHYSPSMFCKENQLNIVGEYLVWYDFVQHAKKFDVPYYIGIDSFLEEYYDAVKRIVGGII